MYCIYCGHTLPEGSKFCTACGKPVRQDDRSAEFQNGTRLSQPSSASSGTWRDSQTMPVSGQTRTRSPDDQHQRQARDRRETKRHTYQRAKGTMQALYGLALLMTVMASVLWFVRVYPTMAGATLSSYEYYQTCLKMASAEFMALRSTKTLVTLVVYQTVCYGTTGLIVLSLLLLLLPTLGLGARTRGMAVIPCFASLCLMMAEMVMISEYLRTWYGEVTAYIDRLPMVTFCFFALQFMAVIFECIVMAIGGRRKVAP